MSAVEVEYKGVVVVKVEGASPGVFFWAIAEPATEVLELPVANARVEDGFNLEGFFAAGMDLGRRRRSRTARRERVGAVGFEERDVERRVNLGCRWQGKAHSDRVDDPRDLERPELLEVELGGRTSGADVTSDEHDEVANFVLGRRHAFAIGVARVASEGGLDVGVGTLLDVAKAGSKSRDVGNA